MMNSITILWITAHGGGVAWNASFVTSDDANHYTEDGYLLLPTSEHSPDAGAALAAGDVDLAVELDMKRVLGEFEARLSVEAPAPIVLKRVVIGASYDATMKMMSMPDAGPVEVQ